MSRTPRQNPEIEDPDDAATAEGAPEAPEAGLPEAEEVEEDEQETLFKRVAAVFACDLAFDV